jgi:triacylglycerol lipase
MRAARLRIVGTSPEWNVVGEHRRLRASPLWPDRHPPPGDGRAVVLISGFGVPPTTVRPLGRWLAAGGWNVEVAPTGWNVDCGEATVGRLSEAIDAIHRSRGPVALVGHSRGGLLARVLAVRHPDRVSDLVTICTPWALGPPDRPGVASVSRAIRFLRQHRVIHTMGSIDCAAGTCCTRVRADMHVTPEPPWTAIWSSRDGIAGEASTPPATAGRAVDIATTHLGAVLSLPGWHAVGTALVGTGWSDRGSTTRARARTGR